MTVLKNNIQVEFASIFNILRFYIGRYQDEILITQEIKAVKNAISFFKIQLKIKGNTVNYFIKKSNRKYHEKAARNFLGNGFQNVF